MMIDHQNTESECFSDATQCRSAHTSEIEVATDVKSLKNHIIKISTTGGLNRCRYELSRQPLIASAMAASLIPKYVHECESTSDICAYMKNYKTWEERRQFIERSFSIAINVLEFDTLNDECKLFLQSGKFDDPSALFAYMNPAFAMAGMQPDRALDMARQLLLHAARAFCTAHYYVWSEDEPLATLLRVRPRSHDRANRRIRIMTETA